MTYEAFCVHYNKWLDDCLLEFNRRYGENRQFHSPPNSKYDRTKLVEFREDGAAFPGESTGYVPNAVTPWAKSKHHVNS